MLFLAGASLAHFIVTPLAMQFFLGFADASSVFTAFVNSLAEGVVEGAPVAGPVATEGGIQIVFQGKVNESLDITLKLIVAFGLCFQLPVLLVLLGRAGLTSAEALGRTRKYAVVGILSLAAVVTPPDVITQIILFVVVYGLYEISILLVARVDRKREADLRAQGLMDDEDDEEAADMADEEAAKE